MKKLVTAVLGILLLSGCTTGSRSNYEIASTALAGSKALRNQVAADCRASAKKNSAASRHQVALIMSVKDSRVDSLFCRRVVNAIASGKMTYKDAMDFKYGRATPKLIRIVQGR